MDLAVKSAVQRLSALEPPVNGFEDKDSVKLLINAIYDRTKQV